MSSLLRQSKLRTKLRRMRQSDYWFPNITLSDFKFIGVLWSSEFIGPWVQVWAENPLLKLQDTNTKNVLTKFYFISFLAKVAITIAVSIVVDLKNHKLLAYFVSLVVFGIGVILGVVAAVVQNAMLYFLPLGLSESLFLTYPAKFCLIFNQKPSATVFETCMVVAIFELINSVSLFVLFFTLYLNSETFSRVVNIIFWIIFVVFTSGLLMLTIFVRRYAAKDVIKESNIPQVLIGIRQDVIKSPGDSTEIAARKTVSTRRFIAFVLLLLPILVITSFEVMLSIIVNSFANENHESDSSRNVYKFLAKLVVMPAIWLLCSGARGFVGRICGLLLIAASHIFNTIVILLIIFYLRTGNIHVVNRTLNDSSPNITVISGHLPNPEQAVVRVFGATETLFILETSTYTSKPDKTCEFVVDVEDGSISLDMEIEDEKHLYEKLELTVEVEANKRYWFLLTTSKRYEFELIQVFGVDAIWTSMEPKLYLLNGDEKLPPDPNKFDITDEQTDVKTSYDVPLPNMTADIVLNPIPYRYKFRYGKGTTNTKYVKLRPYSENVVVLYKYKEEDRLRFHTSILEIRREESTTTPQSPLPPQPTATTPPPQPTTTTTQPPVTDNKKLLRASEVFSGLTRASTTIGYLHFFWMESPARLKTTLLACFIATNEVVGELTKLIQNFGIGKAMVYLALSCSAGLLHITLGYYYDTHFSRPSPQAGEERDVITEGTDAKGITPKENIPEDPPAPNHGVSPPVGSQSTLPPTVTPTPTSSPKLFGLLKLH